MKYALALSLLVLAGCAQLRPGADSLVVRAEQTQQIAFDTFNTFLTLENQNRDLYKQVLPDVHTAAEWLRAPMVQPDGKTLQRGLSILKSFDRVKMAYKYNRTAENKANLTTALATLETTLNEVQAQLSAIKGRP